MRVLVPLAAAVLLALPVAPAQAQDMPDGYRQVQAKMLQLQRKMLLSMVDSMPEALYGDKATPAQRSFAEQIIHAAGPAAALAARAAGEQAPTLPQNAGASRASLRAFVTAAYDYADGLMARQTLAQRNEMVKFFGMDMPRWQTWDEIHQHTIWTAGQVVANFRKNGMAPPGFGFF